MLWYGEDAPSISAAWQRRRRRRMRSFALRIAPLRRIIHRCRRRYDVLVIDGPPLPEQPALRRSGAISSTGR